MFEVKIYLDNGTHLTTDSLNDNMPTVDVLWYE